MPELPEVETTRRGIRPLLVGRRVQAVVVRQRQLRWPVTPALDEALPGRTISDVRRRAKYLLLDTDPAATVLLHLGMSGRLRVVPAATPAAKHDHMDLVLDGGCALRLTDPRRFGACLWIPAGGPPHPLLRHLGAEPLSEALTADYLYRVARRRRVAVKNLLMDSHVVCGVGNIYANEALFRASIHPAARGRQHLAAPLRGPGGGGARRARRGDRGRRHHPARLPRRGRQPWLFHQQSGRVRARRPALPALRNGAQADPYHRPQHLLLPALPALINRLARTGGGVPDTRRAAEFLNQSMKPSCAKVTVGCASPRLAL